MKKKIEFQENEQTFDASFDKGEDMNADFGEVQQISGGDVSASVTQTSEGAVIAITSNGVESTATVYHGKDGLPGANGKDGQDGKDGSPGKDGLPGEPGKDGVSVSHEWEGTVLKVTSASGTSSADLRGEQGIQGVPGAEGSPGADGRTPVKGTDYWTEADKQEIVTEVLSALPVYNGEVVTV